MTESSSTGSNTTLRPALLLACLGLLLVGACSEAEPSVPGEIIAVSGRLTLCGHWRDGLVAGPVGSPLVQRVAEECAAARAELASLRERYAAEPDLLESLQAFEER